MRHEESTAARPQVSRMGLVDWFIPDEIRTGDPDPLLRARLLVVTTTFLTVMVAFMSWEAWRHDPHPYVTTPLLAAAALLAAANLGLLRRWRTVTVPGAILSFLTVGMVGFLSYSNAGIIESALWWMPVGPVLAAFLVGPRFGALVSGLVIVFVIGIFQLHTHGHAFSQPGVHQFRFITFGISSLVAFLAFVTWASESSRRRALVAMGEAVTELQRVNEEARLANEQLAHSRDHAAGVAERKSRFLAGLAQLADTQQLGLNDTRAAMGDVTKTIQSIAANVGSLVNQVGEATDAIGEVEQGGRQMKATLGAVVAAVEETTDAIALVDQSTRQVGSAVDELQRVARRTSESMQSTESSIAEVGETAASTADLARQVIERASQGQDVVRRSLAGNEETRVSAGEAARLMESLGRRIADIDEIRSVIHGVAEQTNLLSLNASIIAAQAGEHGRSFAVVAQEIKELADRSRGSTGEIGRLIESIQFESEQLLAAIARGESAAARGLTWSKEADEALAQIVASAKESTSMVNVIVQSAQQQSRQVRNVVQEMKGVTHTVGQLAAATAEQDSSSHRIMAATQRMQQAVERVERSMDEQTRSNSRAREAVARIDSLTRGVDQAQSEQSRRSQEILDAVEKIHQAQVAQVNSIDREGAGEQVSAAG